MKRITNQKWFLLARQTFSRLSGLKVSLYATHACYFMVLSVFPTLMLLLGLLRYTGLQVDSLTSMLDGFIPNALMGAARQLILSAYHNTSGTVISISAVAALWSASRGVYGLLTGLNSMYCAPENRGYWRTRLISVLYTFGFLIVLLLTLVLHVFGAELLHLAKVGFLLQLAQLRFFVLLFLQTALFTAMYVVLPNRKNRIRDSLPGALLASIGWLVFSDAFSIYVEHVPQYASIFGSVYAVALSMLWLYCCISILFYGGALNHYLSGPENRLRK